jgi:hypothetical protein
MEKAGKDVQTTNGTADAKVNSQTEKIRVQFEVEQTGPYITLYNPSEETGVLIGVKETGPMLKLYSKDGKVRFSAP